MDAYSKIDIKLIKRLSYISKIALSHDEEERFAKELSDVLETFDIIAKVDTEGITPAYHPTEVENVWREDTIEETVWDPFLNSKSNQDQYIKGPKIT